MPETRDAAERCVIGSLVLDRATWPVVQRIMGPEMFVNRACAGIWHAVEAMDGTGLPVDEITLPRYLEQTGMFETVGGFEFLSACVRGVPGAGNADYYARIVREEFLRREALRIGTDLVAKSKLVEFQPEDVLGGAATEIDMLGSLGTNPEPVTIQEVAKSVYADALAGKESERGVSTGMPQLDRALGGLRTGNLVIVAARTGIGKTSLGFNVASHVALSLGKRVLVFSMEMTANEVCGYLTASNGGPNLFLSAGRKLNADEAARLVAASEKISSPFLAMRCGGSLTPSGIVAETKAQHARAPLALVVVDYIGLLGDDPGKRVENTQARVAHASRTLKALALDTGIPILCLAQLNREMDKQDRAPLLHDLRDSGSLEQDANAVLLLHRKLADDSLTPAPTVLTVAKARVMPRNTKISLHFYGAQFRFVEAPFKESE